MRMATSKLKPRHHELARLLMLGNTQREAAAELGLSESHACRIIKTKAFQDHLFKLNEQADQHAFDAIGYFKARAETACNYITDLLDDETTSAAMKLSAAKEVLKWATKPVKQTGVEPVPVYFEDSLP